MVSFQAVPYTKGHFFYVLVADDFITVKASFAVALWSLQFT